MIILAFIVTVILVVAVGLAIVWWINRHQVRKRGVPYAIPDGLDMELPPREHLFDPGWNEFRTIWTAPDGRRFTKQRYVESMRQ